MLGPVQFTNNSKVYFRGENEDLINSPGAFQQAAPAQEEVKDEVVLSNKPDAEEKSGIGKTIAKTIGTVVVIAGALFGLFKWKGAKWLNPEASTKLDKFKNYAVKPGEWLDKTFKNIGKKLGIGGSKTAKSAVTDAAAETKTAKEAATTGTTTTDIGAEA